MISRLYYTLSCPTEYKKQAFLENIVFHDHSPVLIHASIS
jgi:hypothetical protein